MSSKHTLTVKEKLRLIESFKTGCSRKDLADKYKVNISTVSRILKNQGKFEASRTGQENIMRKRFKPGHYDMVNKAVTTWFKDLRSKNAVITGPMICERANQFAISMKIDNFEANDGWLQRWKKNQNITFRKICGEKAAADYGAAGVWTKSTLPNLIKNLSPDQVYNADEAGLFYKALPTGTYASKGESVFGGKISKLRLTLLFLCNSDGSDKHVYVIGKANNPHCCRGKTMPIKYYGQPNAWMTTSIWIEILNNFDKILKKNIVLFVDNASCHKIPNEVIFKHIKIHYLPPNTTSLIQPLDQGIIKNFKVQYRSCLIRKQLLALEGGMSSENFSKRITVLQALKMIKRAWWLVTPTVIKNCFKKAGFINHEEETNVLEDCETIDLPPIPEKEFSSIIDCDDNLECYGDLTESDILKEIGWVNGDKIPDHIDERVDDSDCAVDPLPSRTEAIKAYNIFKNYCESNNLDFDFEKMEDALLKLKTESLIQKKISDFFSTHE